MMGIEESIILRMFPLIERAIADAGDLVAADLVQLQHDIVEWNRAEESIIRRAFPLVEQAIADAGDLVAPDLVQLQHDIVEWDRAGTGNHFTTEALWDEQRQR
tara:strand:- start:11 stop:319 length:309 start_codon:yes stop_codon:yes gene_type:complete